MVELREHICKSGALGDWPKSKFWNLCAADICYSTKCAKQNDILDFSLTALVAEIQSPEVGHPSSASEPNSRIWSTSLADSFLAQCVSYSDAVKSILESTHLCIQLMQR